MSIYEITVKGLKGQDISLSDYQRKVLLIVNTATGCGLTQQYEGLQKLYDDYQEKGFEILDFPCNQFGNQAPGTVDEINSYCTLTYKTSFPRFGKIDVNGANESPLYTFLKKKKGGLLGSKIKWNFTKFLVDRNGAVVKRFAPTDTPESIAQDIANLL